ncbi:uncharacterized protein EV422DRAFT_548089 [Fimicolochytrium jonesii]|uniref:uncharacterized protein n=1 Tax=Fimicolochytrium jonesii TaxID=1396493 RepID=UPI0022FEAED0|nr:uncharacterized protein EV422DRAFT_548089 [Fimicolochytrium jonesii]KAI8815811.1 hypothetical protein EV422DRAFT_548089 [Fimicolochytrium jonesii]
MASKLPATGSSSPPVYASQRRPSLSNPSANNSHHHHHARPSKKQRLAQLAPADPQDMRIAMQAAAGGKTYSWATLPPAPPPVVDNGKKKRKSHKKKVPEDARVEENLSASRHPPELDSVGQTAGTADEAREPSVVPKRRKNPASKAKELATVVDDGPISSSMSRNETPKVNFHRKGEELDRLASPLSPHLSQKKIGAPSLALHSDSKSRSEPQTSPPRTTPAITKSSSSNATRKSAKDTRKQASPSPSPTPQRQPKASQKEPQQPLPPPPRLAPLTKTPGGRQVWVKRRDDDDDVYHRSARNVMGYPLGVAIWRMG